MLSARTCRRLCSTAEVYAHRGDDSEKHVAKRPSEWLAQAKPLPGDLGPVASPTRRRAEPSTGDCHMSTIPERIEGSKPLTVKPRRAFEITGLFGGVGGLELGLSSAGHHASAYCEIDPEAATILRQRSPGAALTRDIRRTDEVIASIGARSDLLTAGFPCTDLSQAGRVRGFAGGRSSLVRDVLRLLEKRPFAHVLLENVPNWRVLHKGEYLREVVTALETLGYKWAYRTIDAMAFGAPQRRLRIFLYATLEGDPRDVLFHGDERAPSLTFGLAERAHGFYWTEGNRGLGWGEDCVPTLKGGSTVGVPSPPAILLPDTDCVAARTMAGEFRLVTPDIRDAERLQGLPADWTAGAETTLDGEPFRQRRRWLLVGNAVNARAAAWLGERLAAPAPWDGEAGAPLDEGSPWPTAAWSDGVRRYAAKLGAWPVVAERPSLAEFLQFPAAPLSFRASSGFLARFVAGSLREKPEFVAALQAHLAKLAPAVLAAERKAA
jgi:DNA (cytosine-5)-methyltransferase 1